MKSEIRETIPAIIILAAFPIILVGNIIHSLLWKVTVSDGNIYIANILDKEKMYSAKDITKVCYKDKNIVIYAGEKKVVKVMSGCENFHYLLAWLLHEEGIKFYDKKGNYFAKKDLMIVFNSKCDREKVGN